MGWGCTNIYLVASLTGHVVVNAGKVTVVVVVSVFLSSGQSITVIGQPMIVSTESVYAVTVVNS